MSDADGVSIVLEVRRAAPVPTGRLCGPHGPPETFEGWLQLLGALQRAFETLAATPGIDDRDHVGPTSPR